MKGDKFSPSILKKASMYEQMCRAIKKFKEYDKERTKYYKQFIDEYNTVVKGLSKIDIELLRNPKIKKLTDKQIKILAKDGENLLARCELLEIQLKQEKKNHSIVKQRYAKLIKTMNKEDYNNLCKFAQDNELMNLSVGQVIDAYINSKSDERLN
jgi:hypothetical protein